MFNLLNDSRIDRVKAAQGAAQTAVDSDVVDTRDADSVLFVAALGTVTDGSVLTLTLQHGDESNGSDMASTTLATAPHTATTGDGTGKLLAVEVNRPLKRYVRARLTRTEEDAVVDGMFAVIGNIPNAPATQPADVLAHAFALSPATA